MRSRLRTIFTLALGAALGAAALGAIWSAGHHTDTEVRIVVERLDDGRVEVGLQQRDVSGDWSDTIDPQHRFLAATAESGPHYSDSIPLTVDREGAVNLEYRNYLIAAGEDIGNDFTEVVPEDAEPGIVLCIIDTRDADMDALCEGMESIYVGPVERVAIDDRAALRQHLIDRVVDEAVTGLLPTSIATALFAWDAEIENDRYLDFIYWIELLDQNIASRNALICQITHSGYELERTDIDLEDEIGEDLFWGLSSEVSAAAAAQMGIHLDFSAHANIEDQVAAIRECIARDADVIATSLPAPAAQADAVQEALDADIPVVSFNSGASAASELGTILHVALDDHEAGRLIGEELTARGIEGNVLCIVHEPNNVGLHERCDGLEETYAGNVEHWSATEDPSWPVTELVDRFAQGDIPTIVTLSVDSAWHARIARYYAESDAEEAGAELNIDITAFGFSLGLARSVAEGRVLFTVLDHPELQAYLSAAAAVMADRWRLEPVHYFNGLSLLIKPQIADAEYMQALIDALYEN